MCSDGTCIVQKWRCDGDPDCGDASDEFVSLKFNLFNSEILREIQFMCNCVYLALAFRKLCPTLTLDFLFFLIPTPLPS